MNARRMIWALAFAAVGARAIELNLSGAVYDSTGKGILGVKVRLAKGGISTRTGPDGNWTIIAAAPASVLGFPDTVVFGDDPEMAGLERVPLSGPERSGIVTIGSRRLLVGRGRSVASGGMREESRSIQDPAGGDVIAGPAPEPALLPRPVRTRSAEAPTGREAGREDSRDSGMVALNWGHTVPSGAFVVEASFDRESWTGSYGLFPLLFDSPTSYGFDLTARYGLWEFGNGARSELNVSGLYLDRNRDAGDYDGFAAPVLGLKFGLFSWMGLEFEGFLPVGSRAIVGPNKDWAYAVGFYLSPRTERFQFDLGAGVRPDPTDIHAHFEPQLNLTRWLGIYASARFQAGLGPLSEAGGEEYTYKLLQVEPGLRMNLGRNFGLGLGVPFTAYGDDQVARWAVQTTLRGAFGL